MNYYDRRDGRVVHIAMTRTFTECSNCGSWFPVEIRRMRELVYRNQPQCRVCRGRYARSDYERPKA